MMVVAVILCCVALCASLVSTEDTCSAAVSQLNETTHMISSLRATMDSMQRQMILSQLYLEEMTRSGSDSGIKQIRGNRDGTRPYYSDSFTGNSFAAIHDHANNDRTIGMGELIAVLNGVEFRTRHNDYRLYMPSTTSSEEGAWENIPFPDVPPEVLAKPTVEEQIVEMREWFKAWQEDDTSPRDYRPYFRPVISYLEGAWYYSRDKIETGESDRHFIDADSYYELEELIRYSSYIGGKQSGENLAFLPRKLINTTEDGTPLYAQWNYRIMCHPIQRDFPLNRLRVVDDLKVRIKNKKTLDELVYDKAARFTMNVWDSNNFVDRQSFQQLQEWIMNEIPGKNNYGCNQEDWGLDGLAMDPNDNTQPLNACNYHRRSQVQIDASGYQFRVRGFADSSNYMAMTDHPEVVAFENPNCVTGPGGADCENPEKQLSQRWSYAIPMEIIWTTPLNTWNPYNITDKGNGYQAYGKTVVADGRDGSEAKPFDGVNSIHYYLTPTDFFELDETNPDPADTTPAGTVFVLDSEGNTRGVRASGTRILWPAINGLNGGQALRQRYPITPVSGEGSAVWKELEALQDILLSPITYSHMFKEEFATGGGGSSSGGGSTGGDMTFTMGFSHSAYTTQHRHTFTLTEMQRSTLSSGSSVSIEATTLDIGHSHALVLGMATECETENPYMITYNTCDGDDDCWDSHDHCVTVEP